MDTNFSPLPTLNPQTAVSAPPQSTPPPAPMPEPKKSSNKIPLLLISGLAVMVVLASGVAYTVIQTNTAAKEKNAVKNQIETVKPISPVSEDTLNNSGSMSADTKTTPTPTVTANGAAEAQVLDKMINNVNSNDFGSKQLDGIQ